MPAPPTLLWCPTPGWDTTGKLMGERYAGVIPESFVKYHYKHLTYFETQTSEVMYSFHSDRRIADPTTPRLAVTTPGFGVGLVREPNQTSAFLLKRETSPEQSPGLSTGSNTGKGRWQQERDRCDLQLQECWQPVVPQPTSSRDRRPHVTNRHRN
ncbi:hypothetical protein DV515_00012743 [Chloebia gouldiae]|uniref:Uncharacterized protein n=1 Tax=Chloebia gouldiae TaxID=44316 RepID=A0A3L8S2X5_CHLGU|nr:hypothetical protein DV515_00012743 [Chloebia gouldiae]